jgi:hypothetical protein
MIHIYRLAGINDEYVSTGTSCSEDFRMERKVLPLVLIIQLVVVTSSYYNIVFVRSSAQLSVSYCFDRRRIFENSCPLSWRS